MAVTYRTSAAGGGTTSNANRTAAITPASGDLLVVFYCASANANVAPTCSDNNPDGLGQYDLIGTALWSTSLNSIGVFVRRALMSNTTATTVTVATGANDAAEIVIVAVSGMSRTGSSAVRSQGSQANQASGATPAPTLNQAALTGNMTLAMVGSGDTTTTPNASWTERQDVSQSTPTTAIEVCTRDSGFTGTTITFGATQSTVFASFAIELDSSAAPSIGSAAGTSTATAVGSSVAVAAGSAAGTSTASVGMALGNSAIAQHIFTDAPNGGNLVTADITTAIGSTLVICVARGNYSFASPVAPSDSLGNTYALKGSLDSYSFGAPAAIGVYVCPKATFGGANHAIANFAGGFGGGGDECTVALIEIKGAGRSGNKLAGALVVSGGTSGSIKTSNEAFILAFVLGEGAVGTAHVVTSSDFTKLASASAETDLDSRGYMQMSSLYRHELAAGTFTGTFTESSGEASTVILLAIEQENIGSAAGSSTATAVGTGIAIAVGSAAGTSTAAATSVSGDSVGAAAGASTAAAVGASTAVAAGAAAGTATVTAVGASTAISTGASAGVGTATGVGAATVAATAASSGSATATATALATAVAAGAAAGVATATAVGAANAEATGAAVGVATATATGQSTAVAAGASSGTATATAASNAIQEATGAAAGTSTATAAGQSTAGASGAATGAATATATGASTAIADGASAGTSSAAAVGAATTIGVGATAGTSTASGIGESTAVAIGAAAGTSTAIAEAVTGDSVGAAAGTSIAAATGSATAVATGTSSGSSTATAIGTPLGIGVGAASGTSTASAEGSAVAEATGAAAGTSTAIAEGQSDASTGEAAGSSTATAVGASVAAATGSAAGTSTAIAQAIEPSVGGGYHPFTPAKRQPKTARRAKRPARIYLRSTLLAAWGRSFAVFDAAVHVAPRVASELRASSGGFNEHDGSTAALGGGARHTAQAVAIAPASTRGDGTSAATAHFKERGQSLAAFVGQARACVVMASAARSLTRIPARARGRAMFDFEEPLSSAYFAPQTRVRIRGPPMLGTSEALFESAGPTAEIRALAGSLFSAVPRTRARTAIRPAGVGSTNFPLQAHSMGKHTSTGGNVISLDSYRRETPAASFRRLSEEIGAPVGVLLPFPEPRADVAPSVSHAVSRVLVRQKSGVEHTHRRRKLPRPRPTTLLETDYAKRIIGILRAQREMIAPLLTQLRLDSIRNDVGEGRRIRAFFDQVRDRTAGDAARVGERASSDIAYRVSIHGLADIDRLTQAAIGMELQLHDSGVPAAIEHFVHENVALIRRLDAAALHDIEGLLLRAVDSPELQQSLAADITARYAVHENHARLIASDQISKLSAKLTTQRHKELGVTRFKWRLGASREHRPKHAAREGKTFSYTGDGKPPEMPGELINCKCYEEPIFDELLDLIRQARG